MRSTAARSPKTRSWCCGRTTDTTWDRSSTGKKVALWEQTTRVPFIISAPCVAKAGSRSNEPVSLLDIYPTLNELCGFQPMEKLDGNSLVPLLKNPAKKTGRAVVTTNGYKNHAVRSDNWRYIRYADGSEELYDQTDDPENFTNLASNPEYDTVKKELSAWLPKSDAKTHPTGNGKRNWQDGEKMRKRNARNENQ